MKVSLAILAYLWLCGVFAAALPTSSNEGETKVESSFASGVSRIIATNLLKFYNDIDGNQVHSPIGVTSILAVLAEGAAGETYEEFNKVFGYPKERVNLRAAYRRILSKYQNREYVTDPSFHTWLYIYRNNSAREEFKQLLRENYFVEVKDISHDEYDWNDPSTSLDLEYTTRASNSKDVIGFETLKHLKDEKSEELVAAVTDNYGEESLDKEASKFDRFVDEKQYVEKPVILEEMQKEKEKENKQEQQKHELEKEKNEKNQTEEKQMKPAEEMIKDVKPMDAVIEKDSDIVKREEVQDLRLVEAELNIEENETVLADEKVPKIYSANEAAATQVVVPINEVLESNEPEKVTIPLHKLESVVVAATKGVGQMMLALESHLNSVRRAFGGRSLMEKNDITSALSANSITGRTVGSKTKMLLFNGLYYRGNWARPFFEQRDSDGYYFMTAEDVVQRPMMHASGKYYMTDMEHLDAKALCIPYENKKYAMMLIVPNQIEGLHAVIEKLQPSDFEYARSNAIEKDLHISLPKFQAEETSRSESVVKNMGLQKLFSREDADLSLLSADQDLHIDEIVQFVSVRVDEGGSSTNSLSTTSMAQARNSEVEDFVVNRPFLYFVMDTEENFVLASGKIQSPEYKPDVIGHMTVEVEFDRK